MRVVVVGGGLAGLAAAVHLHRGGHQVRLLEAAPRLGGRVGSQRHPEGFTLDLGFQVLFPSYPELRALVDLKALGLRPYDQGARVAWRGRWHDLASPLRHPLEAMAALGAPFLSLSDGLALSRLAWELGLSSVDGLLAKPLGLSTEAYLQDLGFSEAFVAAFLRPFFGGVFLDPQLGNDAALFRFYFKMLASEGAAVPEAGMQALPEALGAQLPEGAVQLGRSVASLQRQGDGRVSALLLHDGERMEVEACVVAAPYPEACRLLGWPQALAGRSVATVHLAGPTGPSVAPRLWLHGDRTGLIQVLAPASAAAPGHAPEGQALWTAQVLSLEAPHDDEELGRRVLAEAQAWAPEAQLARVLGIHRSRFAQVALPPGAWAQRPGSLLAPGLALAGDFLTHSSIEGALRSGRLAAQAVAAGLA